ncbi:MAG: energy-coupled thiamine transporter ThiT [Lachnospiraceae bacterium]|nr:energy-coupled thiamine transporter ThiT [Lachnospiraceae bacterium]
MKKSKNIFWNNRILWTLILLALATGLSCIKVIVLPQGGCVTYFGLLALWLITFVCGSKYGIASSVIFGFIRFGLNILTGEYVNPAIGSIVLEYPIAHLMFSLGAMVHEPNNPDVIRIDENEAIQVEPMKLKLGYVMGLVGMFVCYVISAEIFYPNYREGFAANLWYNIVYDGSYLLIEGVLTLLVLCIPQVAESIFYVKYVANNVDEDDTLECF